LVLPEEVNTTLSVAERSKTTGHLMIKMPKVGSMISYFPPHFCVFKINVKGPNISIETKSQVVNKTQDKHPYVLFVFSYQFLSLNFSSTSSSTYLEFDKDPSSTIDYTQIVNQNKKNSQLKTKLNPQKERENSVDFIDDPDVPPLI